jgi:hypothetical protein
MKKRILKMTIMKTREMKMEAHLKMKNHRNQYSRLIATLDDKSGDNGNSNDRNDSDEKW